MKPDELYGLVCIIYTDSWKLASVKPIPKNAQIDPGIPLQQHYFKGFQGLRSDS